MIQIYTDGACFPNPNGFGGWAFVAANDNDIKYIESGNERNTTNNRMELTAILMAMQWCDKGTYIYSDSQYCVNAITKWYDNWVKANKLDERCNIDLIADANELYKEKNLKLKWVKGHNGNVYNETADDWASSEMRALYEEINGVPLSLEEVTAQFAKLKKNQKVWENNKHNYDIQHKKRKKRR